MQKKKEKRELTERERKLREYYWKCFISEISKIGIFSLIFISLGLTTEYLIALISLMLLRNHGGGLHFNHYTSCLIVSFAFLYGSILLAKYTHPSAMFMYGSIILCAVMGYYLVPITSSNRPKATPEQIQRSKKKTAMIIFIFLLLICLCPHSAYFYISYWTIILHIMQLFVAKITERRGNYA